MSSWTETNFWKRVQQQGDCWLWVGSKAQAPGKKLIYGVTKKDRRRQLVHRVAYELMVGPVPEGLTIDHLCRNTLCVNPEHLDPVPLAVNIRRAADAVRKPYCPSGHPFDETNNYRRPGGSRVCRPCRAAGMRRINAKAKRSV